MGVQRILIDGQRTWTVTGDDHLPAGPVEEYLEFLRVAQQCLAEHGSFLCHVPGPLVGVPGRRRGRRGTRSGCRSSSRSFRRCGPGCRPGWPRSRAAGAAGPSESTIAARVTAVLSFYRYHSDAHQVPVADRLYRIGGRAGRYVPGLAHLQRGRQQPGSAVRVRRTAARPVPLLTPAQVEAILDACARQDASSGQWTGSVRDRLLFAALAETGMRLGELLSTRHCDWHAGRGGTPFIEVIPRQDHPAGVRCKSSRYRRIYISDELERLHSEYVWQLCDAGAHLEVDLAGHFVLVNLRRGRWLAPMRPETVYDKVASLKRGLGGAVPAGWTPHWFRHTHASALLLSGAREHVVMRRLGHADIQTTVNLYGWVSEDAELRALADWRSFCAGWRGWDGAGE